MKNWTKPNPTRKYQSSTQNRPKYGTIKINPTRSQVWTKSKALTQHDLNRIRVKSDYPTWIPDPIIITKKKGGEGGIKAFLLSIRNNIGPWRCLCVCYWDKYKLSFRSFFREKIDMPLTDRFTINKYRMAKKVITADYNRNS